jgi:hypothetical protein
MLSVKMIKPKYFVCLTLNSHFLIFAYSLAAYSCSTTCFIYTSCSSSLEE